MRHVPWNEDPLYEAIFAHVGRHVGSIEAVYNVPGPALVHLDIIWVKPSPERNHHTLITAGMSSRPMAPPEGARECRFAELFLSLPPDWPIGLHVLNDARYGWPFEQLGSLALLPHVQESWLWYGHSVAEGEDLKPFAPGTGFCAWVLGPHLSLGHEACRLRLGPDREVCFFSALPLYREELELTFRKGIDALFSRLAAAGVSDVVDVGRRNVADRRRRRDRRI